MIIMLERFRRWNRDILKHVNTGKINDTLSSKCHSCPPVVDVHIAFLLSRGASVDPVEHYRCSFCCWLPGDLALARIPAVARDPVVNIVSTVESVPPVVGVHITFLLSLMLLSTLLLPMFFLPLAPWRSCCCSCSCCCWFP
jgi:hypothetical protein